MPVEPPGLRTAFGGLVNSETAWLPDGGALTEESLAGAEPGKKRVSAVSVPSAAGRRLVMRVCGLDGASVYAAGSPEYDMLANRDARRILFMPAYREKLAGGADAVKTDFGGSEYCRAVNGLLCDERLFDAADEYGYAFDFAPHTETLQWLAYFEMDETVNTVMPGRPARALLAGASLLVTDCLPASGVARMGRPVLYFRFAEGEGLPPGRGFDRAGSFPDGAPLGRVTGDRDALADMIIAYMAGGCIPTEEDRRLADAFFAHRDAGNRERIYGIMNGKGAEN
jgi:hypothetical protein